MRTIIDLPDEQLMALRDLCEREGISRAEAIRRAIAEWLESPERTRARRHAALQSTFGAWKHKNLDALEHVRALRDEWER